MSVVVVVVVFEYTVTVVLNLLSIVFYRVCILNIDVQLLENAKYTQQVQITIETIYKRNIRH